MTALPNALYTAAEVKQLDKLALEVHKMTNLMARAGQAAFQVMQQAWPEKNAVFIFAGAGNNAGDGFVLARLAEKAGYSVTLILLSDAKQLEGDALDAFQQLKTSQVNISKEVGLKIPKEAILVDALIGTGLSKKVSGKWAKAIENMNAANAPTLAIDIPSGLCADTGQVQGVAVQASLCITFIGLKTGLFTGEGPDYCGKLVFNDLGVPSSLYSDVKASALRLGPKTLFKLGARKRTAHKMSQGHLLLVGGDQGMSGAIHLAGEAALRCGAGLVTLATHPDHAGWLNTNRPELMCHAIKKANDLKPLLLRATCIAIGPGLGQSRWSRKMLQAILNIDKPMVLDADALNLLAENPGLTASMLSHPGRIMTPHPGEASRLLGLSTKKLQKNRLKAAKDISNLFAGICVLKGAGSIITAPNETIYLCDKGNPGMATAGTGDVLTGIIGALIAQNVPPFEAAKLGVYLHASAGDIAAQQGERGLIAGDLMPILRRLVNI